MTPAELKSLDASDLLSEVAGSVDARFDCNPEVRRLRVATNALPALIRLWEAAEDCDNAHRHVDVCDTMHHLRGCSCGHEQLAAALRELREMKL